MEEERRNRERDCGQVSDVRPRWDGHVLVKDQVVDRPDHLAERPGAAGRGQQPPETAHRALQAQARAQAQDRGCNHRDHGAKVVDVEGCHLAANTHGEPHGDHTGDQRNDGQRRKKRHILPNPLHLQGIGSAAMRLELLAEKRAHESPGNDLSRHLAFADLCTGKIMDWCPPGDSLSFV